MMVEHRAARHPYVYSTHYEIVGKELLEKQLYRHFFVPLAALSCQIYRSVNQQLESAGTSSSLDTNNSQLQLPLNIKLENTNELRAIEYTDKKSSLEDSLLTPEDAYHVENPSICSKCKKECINMITLYSHMLTCSGDYAWIQAKKRMKYRRVKRRRVNRSTILSKKMMKVTPTKTPPADSSNSPKDAGKKIKTTTPKPKDSDSKYNGNTY
jgi:hypothetical protein